MEFKSKYSPSTKFSSEGLLIVERGWSEVGLKILDSERYLRTRIRNALKEGKTILLLPGGYDILHAGHVTWIDQTIDRAIQNNQEENSTMSRDDLYVVIPIGSDPLVNVTKRYKHKIEGGTELIPRPIITEEGRLLALANLESVDLTVAIPSPLTLDTILEQPEEITIKYAYKLLDQRAKEEMINENDYLSLKNSLNIYEAIRSDHGYGSMRNDFIKKLIPKKTFEKINDSETVEWDMATWDIMWHLFLSENAVYKLPKIKKDLKRIVSMRDGYRAKADYIARLAGISIDIILDEYITSTTQLIADHGYTPRSLEELVGSSKIYKFIKPGI